MVSEKPMYKKISGTSTDSRDIALWALTSRGALVANRLLEKTGYDKCYVGSSITAAPAGAFRFNSLAESVGKAFDKFSAHIFIMAVGIVVRTIAPHVKNKLSDPAVVVVDDHAKFAISLLSGHLGGANELAVQVAKHLGAVPVITTATDLDHVPAIDLLAKRYGLVIENPEQIKKVHMALLERQKIRLHDPMNLLKNDVHGWVEYKTDLAQQSIPGVFVDFKVIDYPEQMLVLRPKILSVGIGCNRNTTANEILESVNGVFHRFDLSVNAINNIATIEAKADEEGIIRLAHAFDVPVSFFDRQELSGAGYVPTPSEVVKKHMGVASVCEAAAILASNRGKLLVPKQVTKNVTVAVAVRRSTLLE
jgi:cobalt-precorrin 5A hydrolase